MKKHQHVTMSGTAVASINGGKAYDYCVAINGISGQILEPLFFAGLIAALQGTVMFRRSFVEKHHIRYDLKLDSLEDLSLFEQIIDNGGIIANIPQPLYFYRMHSSNSHEHYQRVSQQGKDFFSNRWRNGFFQIYHSKWDYVVT